MKVLELINRLANAPFDAEVFFEGEASPESLSSVMFCRDGSWHNGSIDDKRDAVMLLSYPHSCYRTDKRVTELDQDIQLG